MLKPDMAKKNKASVLQQGHKAKYKCNSVNLPQLRRLL